MQLELEHRQLGAFRKSAGVDRLCWKPTGGRFRPKKDLQLP